jgi:carbohydrate-binding DOMON domain-containing protein
VAKRHSHRTTHRNTADGALRLLVRATNHASSALSHVRIRYADDLGVREAKCNPLKQTGAKHKVLHQQSKIPTSVVTSEARTRVECTVSLPHIATYTNTHTQQNTTPHHTYFTSPQASSRLRPVDPLAFVSRARGEPNAAASGLGGAASRAAARLLPDARQAFQGRPGPSEVSEVCCAGAHPEPRV